MLIVNILYQKILILVFWKKYKINIIYFFPFTTLKFKICKIPYMYKFIGKYLFNICIN